MNPSIIKYRIRFLDIKPEKPDKKISLGNTIMSKLQKGGNNRLSLRQRQAKVNDSLEEEYYDSNGKIAHQHEPEPVETFQVFRGEVENPMV